MDLDEYKNIKQKSEEAFLPKGSLELARYMRGQTQSIINGINRSLRFELVFATLFLIFDCFMCIFFQDVFFLRMLTVVLLIFCISFIFYVIRLLRYIRTQYRLDNSVKELLAKYIYIIARFTRLYFQVTMIMVPLILCTALVAGYLDREQSVNFLNMFGSQTVLIYLGSAFAWCFLMYFFTRWYIKKLYGNQLSKLKKQLKELQDME